MADSLSLLMKSLLKLNRQSHHTVAWQPLADIYQSENHWVLKVELAGINLEDITLTTIGHRLILEGYRRDSPSKPINISESLEIAYNRFERVFDFSFDVENTRIEIEYHNGMLFIYLSSGEVFNGIP